MKKLFAVALFLISFAAIADEFAKVIPARQFSFPADHNPRDDFQSQWWYITTSLQGEDGTRYGAQFTLFSNALVLGGQTQRIYFAHAAVSSPSGFYHAERFARADMLHGGVNASPWYAFIDHWQLEGTGPNPLPGTLSVKEPKFGYTLQLSASPYFLQGDKGFSRKNSAGSLASYYYNAPFIKVNGEINLADKAVKVTGKGWYDREFSTGMFTPADNGGILLDNIGWDWLSLHLNDSTALMLYRVHSKNEVYLDGVIMKKDGNKKILKAEQINWQGRRKKSFGNRQYTIEWSLKIPLHQIDIIISPINDNQFMNGSIPYWEGAVTTKGSHNASGYLELFAR